MYCKKCGKELLDEAVVCTGCGTWVKESTEKQSTPKGVGKNAKLAKLFGVIAFSLIMATWFFVFVGIADISLNTTSYRYNGPWTSGSFSAALVFGLCGLGFGITSFVFGLKEKENIAVKYVSNLIFVTSVVTYLIPILFM